MRSFTLLLAFFILVPVVRTDEEVCKIIDWEEKAQGLQGLIIKVNELLGSPMFAEIKKKLGLIRLLGENQFSGSVPYQLMDHDFRFDFFVNTVRIEGLDTVKLEPTVAIDNQTITVGLGLDRLRIMTDIRIMMNQLTSVNCTDQEEEWGGHCYKSCYLLTNGQYPRRTMVNTCNKNGCGPGWEQSAALCYPKCDTGYDGVGPVCWGNCKKIYGQDFIDMGMWCQRWSPFWSREKPAYGRGIGALPDEPWVKGLVCDGFAVSASGGCGYKVWKYCFTEDFKIVGNKDCKPKVAWGWIDFEIKQPKITTELKLEALKCPNVPNEMGVDPVVACHLGKAMGIIMGMVGNDQASVNASIEAFAKGFKSIEVSKFKFEYDAIPKTNFNVLTNGLVGVLVNFAKGFLRDKLRDGEFVRNQLLPMLADVTVKSVNKEIKLNFEQYLNKC